VTGPVFDAGRDTQWLGRRRIAVPHAYFCAVRRTGTPELLALLVPNARNGYSWPDAPGFLVSIDSVEKLTGLDLFPMLKPDETQRLESAPARQLWPRPDKRRRP
jgi:endonuclease G